MFYANENEQSQPWDLLLALESSSSVVVAGFCFVSISISTMNKLIYIDNFTVFFRYGIWNWSLFSHLVKWFGWLFLTLVQIFDVHLFCLFIDYRLLEHSEWLQMNTFFSCSHWSRRDAMVRKFPSDRDSTSSNWRCNAMLENETKNTSAIEWKNGTKFI